MSRRSRYRHVATFLMAIAPALIAEDDFEGLDLAELFNLKVTTTSKRAEAIKDAPGIVSVITKYEIEQLGATNLIEVLKTAPSLQMYYSSVFDKNKASFRGDAFNYLDNHTLILIDGRPAREGFRNGLDAPIYQMFPVNTIERIEVVRGPGSVLYGSTAMSGVINIITQKEKAENNFTAAVNTEGDLYQSALLSMVKEDRGIIIANTFNNSNSDTYEGKSRPRPFPPFGESEVQEWEHNMHNMEVGLFGKAYLNDLTLTSFWGINRYSDLGWLVHKDAIADNNLQQRGFLNLDHQHKFNDDWTLTTSGTWNYQNTELFAQITMDSIIPQGSEDTVGIESSSDFLIESYVNGSPLEDLNILAGGLISNENKWNIPGNPLLTRVPNRYHTIFYSAYGQVDYTILDEVKLLAGLQGNKRRGEDVDIVPRVGVIASDIWSGIGTKVLFGQAYRSPIPAERVYIRPSENNSLDAEKISTLDAQVMYNNEHLNVAGTFFKSWLDNFISLDQSLDNNGFYNNTDKYSTTGFELEARGNPVEGLMVYGSWLNQVTNRTYTPEGTTEEVTDLKVSNAPQWMLKCGVNYTTPFKLSTSLNMETYGEQSLYGFMDSQNPVDQKIAKDNKTSVILDFNVGYTFPTKKKLHLKFLVKNILDDAAMQPFLIGGGIPIGYPMIERENGRSFNLMLSAGF